MELGKTKLVSKWIIINGVRYQPFILVKPFIVSQLARNELVRYRG